MPRPKDVKLKDALKRHKGIDQRQEYKKKQQKKSEKQAEKRKRAKTENDEDDEILRRAIAEAAAAQAEFGEGVPAPKRKKLNRKKDEDEGEEWETEDDDDDEPQFDLSRLQDSDTSDSEEEDDDDEDEDDEEDAVAKINGEDEDEDDEDEDEDEDDEEDIPLSDLESLASADKEDVIPHQRLTINNHAALLRAHKSIALPSSFPWIATQSVTSAEPTVIEDIEDDLGRELAFYKQSLDAVTQARSQLKAAGIPFSRPADYFAEMVKSDEHMGKIKKKLVDEAAGKKAAAEARKQRDLRKFGKQVQVAKLQEREKAKRDTMDKINMLKRSKFSPHQLITYHANALRQSGQAQTLQMRTRTRCLMSLWRMLRRRTARIVLNVEPRERVRASRAQRDRSATRSMASAARSVLRRVMMQSRALICRTIL